MRLHYQTYSLATGIKRIKTKAAIAVSAVGLLAGSGGFALAAMGAAHAETMAPINFEPSSYTLGDINGQNGWSKTGAYDAAVVANTSGYASFDTQSLRISNAVISGSFGDQTFAPKLSEQAGEPNAWDVTGNPVASPRSHFEAQFDLASVTKANQGMSLSVSPDNGVGARMSYLRFDDETDGIHVAFDDVQGIGDPANFVETPHIATLSYDAPHTIKISMDFVNGPSNAVVNVYIDGVLVHTGTSWENYYRYDSESNPELIDVSRTVDTLLFAERGTADPANSGKGYIIDNLSMASSTPVQTVAGCSFDESVPGVWTLLADCTSTAVINVPTNTTLDGAHHTISAGFSKTDNSNNAVLGVISSTGVTIENLTIDGTNGPDLHGINIYVSTNVSVHDVTLSNLSRIGLNVNGSDVTVSHVTTSNSGWEGIDVDSGSGVTQASTLNVVGPMNQYNEERDIYVDNTSKTFTVNDVLHQYTFQNSVFLPGDRLYTEKAVTPDMKDQCFNGNWRNFQTQFKNQGDCVSFVATKGKNQPVDY